MTPLERRERLDMLLKSDETYQLMKAEYDQAEVIFDDIATPFPEQLRNQLWTYPGMGYLLYHHTLNLICQHMKFPDEA